MISRLAPVWAAAIAAGLTVSLAVSLAHAEDPVPGSDATASASSGEAAAEITEAAPAASPAEADADIAADMAQAAQGASTPADAAPAADADADAADAQSAEAGAMATDEAADAPADLASGSDDSEAAEVAPAAPAKPAVVLGEIGYDELGRQGRIHIVVRGDTLWDISDAYLGTPWVWPSIWTDNADIANPHLILPGDHIWITPYEMRRISKEEADALLAGSPADDSEGDELAEPEPVPADVAPRTYTVSSIESSGLITAEQLEASASIIDSIAPRVMMAQPDDVYIGYGADEVSAGDQFTVFRTREKVFDPDTNRLLGYHVDLLGWLEVTQPDEETSIAVIRESSSEIEAGDRIIPREAPVHDIEVLDPPTGVEGKLSFFPKSRTTMGTDDFVYLNRGSLDGLHVGSPLIVYREGWNAPEQARNERVLIPDRPIADLLVVSARPETAVAVVTHTTTELELGDRFRGGEMYSTIVPVSQAKINVE